MKPVKKRRGGKYLAPRVKRPPASGYAVPFFVALCVLTVISFIIPLRPTRSHNEKRNLAEFPDFSWAALSSGDYFDDITLWFSDTFPGRDGWIRLSTNTKELHGFQDVVIYGDVSAQETIPDEYVPSVIETRPPEPTVPETEFVEIQTTPVETEPPDTTPPTTPVEEWGGVDAGEGAEIYLGSVIQIDNAAFNYFKFSKSESDRFVNTMTWYSEAVAHREDMNVVTVAIPSSVGVMVESEYQSKIGCADQGDAIEYVYSGLPEDVVAVNIFPTLVEHNDEYLYFRTDHHWTAQAGYYCYREICNAIGREPLELEEYEEWDQGTFRGSLYYKCNQSSKLELDNVYAYNPPGDISMMITGDSGRFSWPVLTDMSKSKENAKYMTFLAGDHPLCEITNNDLPDGGTCIIVKNSFGNCVAPFFAANYNKVIVVDYREYKAMNMQKMVEQYDADDIIFLITLEVIQDNTYNNLLRKACGF